MDRFRPVTMDDRPLFLSHYKQFPQVHSDNLFANIVCWNHYAHYRFAYIGDALLLCSTINGKTKFRPPIGPRDPDLLADVMHLAAREGADAPLVLVDIEAKKWIQEAFPALPLQSDRDYFEYVYRTNDLATLPGGSYLTIRRHLNKFRKNCNPIVEPIREDNLPEVEEFLREWCEWKNCNGHPFLSYEKEAVLYAISHFRDLGLSGLLIRVMDKVGAMVLFEELNPTTAVVHFEKGLPDCEGIYKAINTETAMFLKDRYEFINRESDMGVPGLREAKMRYHPHHMVEVWYAWKEDIIRNVT